MSDPTASPEAVMEAYIEGTRTCNTNLLRQIFAEGAVMSGWFGHDLEHGGPEPFYEALEGGEVGPDYTAHITELSQTDRIATATLRETNLMGLSYTNHFHMITLADGTWRITAKLYRHD